MFSRECWMLNNPSRLNFSLWKTLNHKNSKKHDKTVHILISVTLFLVHKDFTAHILQNKANESQVSEASKRFPLQTEVELEEFENELANLEFPTKMVSLSVKIFENKISIVLF